MEKAPGDIRILVEFYKHVPVELLEIMCRKMNDDRFKRSLIFAIFMKGDVGQVENYRGISFSSRRLREWTNENRALNEYQ